MDAGGLGALIGISLMVTISISICLYDKCRTKKQIETNNPLLIKRSSFKVKNLFSHVQI
jgi:hypothetical protein